METRKCTKCSDKPIADCREIIMAFSKSRDSLIPILQAIQTRTGYLPTNAMEETASYLAIPASEVYGAATFYSLFAVQPKGKYVIRLCDSPPCHVEGAESIRHAICHHLNLSVGDTTPDGLFTFESVSCIGLCGDAPAMMINSDVYGNLSPDMVPGILDNYVEEVA